MTKKRAICGLLTVVAWLVVALSACDQAFAQICRPVSQRAGEVGCWITLRAPLGKLPPPPIFWHLATYPTRAAAEVAKGQRAAVVESIGKVWHVTIPERGWRPSTAGRRAASARLPV